MVLPLITLKFCHTMYLTPLSIGSGYSIIAGVPQIQSGPTFLAPDLFWNIYGTLGPDPDQVRSYRPYRSHCKCQVVEYDDAKG